MIPCRLARIWATPDDPDTWQCLHNANLQLINTDMAYHGNYISPTDLLNDESLSHLDKVKMLKSWRDDKKAYLRASEEGMPGDARSDLLQRIEEALRLLPEDPPA